MNPMRRLGMAALLVALAAILAASSAFAGRPPKPVESYTYQLTPPEIDPPEPQASGRWTKTVNWAYTHPRTDVEVSSVRLTAGELYFVVASVSWTDPWGNHGSYQAGRAFTADGKGRLAARFSVQEWERQVWVDDLWIEKDGNVVLETRR